MANTESQSTSMSGPRPFPFRWLRWRLHHVFHGCLLLAIIGVIVYGWQGVLWSIPALLMVPLLADGMARPASNLFYPTITHGARGRQRVALTFDDGPDPDVTPQVLDALADYGARATFFVIGKSLAAQPALAHRMLADGHVIGNHSWQHSRWQNFYSFRWQQQEIEHSLESIAAATDRAAPVWYRPPVGLKNWAMARAIWQRGLILVAWSLHSRDTRLQDAQAVAERVLGKVRNGDIVLLHDGHDLPGRQRPYCAPAVRLILEGLRARGFECVTVPELLDLPDSEIPGPGT